MRTAIHDIAEGAEMGLETGSVSGLSCSLYGSVDFGEDYREVTGRLAVPEKLYVYVVPFEIRSLLKSWKTSFGNVFRTIPCHERLWHLISGRKPFRSFSIPYPMHECGSGGISPPCPVYGHADALPAGILIQAVFVRHHLPAHASAGWLSGSVSRAVRPAVCPGL